MEQTGCLKKRRRRNLAKVTGLSLTQYDADADTYRGLDIYQSYIPPDSLSDRFQLASQLFLEARKSGNIRVTRDPAFSLPEEVQDNFDYDDDVASPEEDDNNDNADMDIELGYSRPKNGGLNVIKSQEAKDRPYLLDSTVIARLKQLLLLGKTSGSFPWSWNKKEHRIDRWSPFLEKLWVFIWAFVTVQTLFLTLFQFYSFYSRVKGATKTYREVFMSSLSAYWYICAVYFNVNMYLYKDQIRQYINTMFALNRDLCEKFLVEIKGYKDGGRILINLSIPSNCSQVFASVALFCVMPYQPWYTYSYIYKPDNPWYWLLPGAFQEFVVVGQVITSYMLTSWIVVAHTNSVDFWLKEIHNNNDSEYTIPQIREPKTAIEIYRALQILCTCFNDCMAPLAIPLVKVHILTGLIPCGYVLIRSMNHLFVDEFPGILTYPIGVIDCATAGFAFLSMGAEMFDLGCSFIDSWSLTKQKDFRRILRSLPTLKVMVGHWYHITVSTTITFFYATTNYIIDCIVTFP